MSSSISYETCPYCKSEGALYAELNCRTGEDTQFCMECGYSYDYRLVRDEDDNVITNNIEYDVECCILAVTKGKDIIWQKKLSEIPGGYLSIFKNWGGFNFSRNEEYEKLLKDVLGEAVPDGYRDVFYMGDEEPESLYGFSRYIAKDECDDEKLVLKQASYEEIEIPGYGVINIAMVSGGGSSSSVGENASKEDIIEEVKRIKDMNPTTVKGVYATWFNSETKTLEILSEIEEEHS